MVVQRQGLTNTRQIMVLYMCFTTNAHCGKYLVRSFYLITPLVMPTNKKRLAHTTRCIRTTKNRVGRTHDTSLGRFVLITAPLAFEVRCPQVWVPVFHILLICVLP